jgi:hypothetical protein
MTNLEFHIMEKQDNERSSNHLLGIRRSRMGMGNEISGGEEL